MKEPRDPRMACVIPATTEPVIYTIRVELANPAGEPLEPLVPFLLDVSLRKIAPSGTSIFSAFAISSAGGF